MIVRGAVLATGLLAAALFLAACAGDSSYPVDRRDDAYDLAAMRLRPADLPAGYEEADIAQHEFDNDDWVKVTGAADADARKAQLDAQGRLRAYVSVYQPKQLGRVFSINAISTLYTDANKADQSAVKFLCGTPTDDKALTEPFPPPSLGDQSVGFLVPPTGVANGDPPISETTLCFRTGRILHAITLTGLAGTEDVALSVKLAQRMLARIDEAFAGRSTPEASATPAGG
ncbi:MAG: hypothetical protein IT304_01975 [Dehalococcoidia bacterium]|nr:hypothetical protein [Dehalococcoidia bacterium]